MFMEVGDKPVVVAFCCSFGVSGRVSLFLQQGRIPLPLLVTWPELILEYTPIFRSHSGLVAPGADFQPCSPLEDVSAPGYFLLVGDDEEEIDLSM